MTIENLYFSAKSSLALRRLRRALARINALEPWARAVPDECLAAEFAQAAQTPGGAAQLKGFALAREAARRVLGLRLYDVQVLGGLLLAQGKLAQMHTGEGKTLTIVAPAALLAARKKGVHVVTANSYLAQRDAQAMGAVYAALGLSVGALREDLPREQRQAAYACDITYGVGHEFGFDYLRDNLVSRLEDRVQRERFAAIVDEVDSVLIDDARTPLIISGSAGDTAQTAVLLEAVVRELQPGRDYVVNLKEHDAALTEEGYDRAEQLLVRAGAVPQAAALYDAAHLGLVRKLHSAVRAAALYKRDRHYVVEGAEIVLVDESTGRKMHGRRLEDGVHEALEAREGVPVNSGSAVRASITYQTYFGSYTHLAGLSGTVLTEADEFSEVYALDAVAVPPNRPSRREDLDDLVFATKAQKFAAMVEQVQARHAKGQPVLVGCPTVRDALAASALLTRAGVPHETLTAKHAHNEARIIAQAGRAGAVTVATNMAGRGTDIILGGAKPPSSAGAAGEGSRDGAASPADAGVELARWTAERETVESLGGLFVLGLERHTIRRVDNQLAGRAGRQGERGQTQFLVSLEDDLFKPFAADKKLQAALRMLGAGQASAVTGATVVSLVRAAQRRAQSQGFDARRSLMRTDKVLSAQRAAVYDLRTQLLQDEPCAQYVRAQLRVQAQALAHEFWPDEFLDPAQLDARALKTALEERLGLTLPVAGWLREEELTREDLAQRIEQQAAEALRERGPDLAHQRSVLLATLGRLWSEHLGIMDELHKALSLKPPTGMNPLHQYSREAFLLFEGFGAQLGAQALAQISRTWASPPASVVAQPEPTSASAPATPSPEQRVALAAHRRWLHRNEPCPCGSGLRFKRCHGQDSSGRAASAAPGANVAASPALAAA